MKKALILITFFLCLFNSDKVFGIGEKLSPLAEVSILTCSAGEELYSVLGHSAIRVSDPMNNIDYVYNYGTFDFGAPNFYLKFARGQLDYMLSVELFKNFRQDYEDEKRSVYEQVLDISLQEKQQVFLLLETNAKPENKFYKYDFFHDNCATKVRDIIQKALNNKIKFPDLKGEKTSTFRELIEPYMIYQKWSFFGIDVLLGLPSDREIHSYEYMFLPDQLQIGFQTAKYINSNKPLLKVGHVVYDAKSPVADTTADVTPNMVFWSLFAIAFILSIFLWKKNPIRYWFDFSLFFVWGLLGLIMLLMWFATDHKSTAWNLNLLWALPSHLVFAFILLKKNKPRFMNFYFLGTSLLTLILLLSFHALPQGLHVAVIPILLTILLRSFIIFWKENRD